MKQLPAFSALQKTTLHRGHMMMPVGVYVHWEVCSTERRCHSCLTATSSLKNGILLLSEILHKVIISAVEVDVHDVSRHGRMGNWLAHPEYNSTKVYAAHTYMRAPTKIPSDSAVPSLTSSICCGLAPPTCLPGTRIVPCCLLPHADSSRTHSFTERGLQM